MTRALASQVASHAEAWIETTAMASGAFRRAVASHAEAWIETYAWTLVSNTNPVASHAEAWIETLCGGHIAARRRVASHAEAWIETRGSEPSPEGEESPPTRRRGSKQAPEFCRKPPPGRLPRGGVDRNRYEGQADNDPGVASHAEAWIETARR